MPHLGFFWIGCSGSSAENANVSVLLIEAGGGR
jgi:hypothetical protein